MSWIGNRRLEEYARSMQMSPREVAVGLEEALWESGPNPLTEFADALEFEGKNQMPPEESARWEAMGHFREALTKFLANKNVAFIGGVAVRSYGGRLGPTQDYDILLDPTLLQETVAFLGTQGGQLEASVEDPFIFHIPTPDMKLDLRVARSPLDLEALFTAQPARFQGRPLKLVRPAPLAAMKLKAYSERKQLPKGRLDREDIRGLIACGATTEEEIRATLLRHRPDLLPELEEVLRP